MALSTGDLEIYSEVVYNYLSDNLDVLKELVTYNDEYVDNRYKYLLFEKYPESIDNPDFIFSVFVDTEFVDLMLERNPTFIKHKDERGENILFNTTRSKYKELLVKEYPEEVECINNNGMNILFSLYLEDKYKDLLLARKPEFIKHKYRGKSIIHYTSDVKYTDLYIETCPEEINLLSLDYTFTRLSKKRIYALIESDPEILKKKGDTGTNMFFYEDIPDEFKDLLFEKYPEEIACVCDEGTNILFHNNISDKYKNILVNTYPHAVEQIDTYGESILYYKTDTKYKDMLVARRPNSLNYIDLKDTNIENKYKLMAVKEYPRILNIPDILEDSSIPCYYKDLALEMYPCTFTNSRSLFSYTIDRKYKLKLVDMNPEILRCVNSLNQNILFNPDVHVSFKYMLVERWPSELTQVDNCNKNILFYKHVDDFFKQKLVDLYPSELASIDDKGKSILFYKHVPQKYKNKLVEMYPQELNRVLKNGYSLVRKDCGDIVKVFTGNKSKSQGTCAVCLCDYEVGEYVTNFDCGHNLHPECFIMNKKALKAKYKCYCKKK